MILNQLTENVDCFVLEVFSWENDWDHHEHNLFFFDEVEELKVALDILDSLIVKDSEIESLDEEKKDLALELVGGYQYESNIPRTADTYAIGRLDSFGKLSKISKNDLT